MEEGLPPSTSPADHARRRSCLFRAAVVAGIFLIAALAWALWHNRPIRPVVLTGPEQAAVERKIATLQAPAELPASSAEELATTPAGQPPAPYRPGKREIAFTDRELNGLLNANSELGDQIAFEFQPDVVVARIATPLPDDLPLVGGTTLRARAKFSVETSGTSPRLALEDMTVWGISIPNEWLGGMKNINLLEQAFGAEPGKGIPGVESLTFETGRLLLRLKE